MGYGIKPTRIVLEGWAIPDEVSIDAVYTGDDADWDTTPGVGGEDQWKQPCRAATTAAITIATALNAGDTLDGVTLAAGDRVLVKDQGTASQNGIYIVGTTPVRAADMDADVEIVGAVVYVVEGTDNAGTAWAVTNDAVTVDTDAMDWAAFGGGTGGGNDTSLSTVAASGATETLDVSVARTHDVTLTADCTFTFSGAVTAEAWFFTLVLRQDGTGGWDATWPASVVWPGGTAPVLDTTASTAEVLTFFTLDGGTVWFGFEAGGGGTTIDPATSVESETTWGITPAVGTDPEYARQDHTHGTPPQPATGELLVADVPLEFPHATFFALADQTVASTTTAYAVAFDGEGDVDGLTHSTVTNNSRITIQQSGEYSLIVSAVATITGGANYHAEMWIAIDGTPVANSNTILQIPNASTEMVMAVAYNGDLTAGQYVEVMYRGDNTAVQFLYTAAGTSPTRPASPAVVLTMNMEAPTAGIVSKGITLLLNDAGDDLLYADTA